MIILFQFFKNIRQIGQRYSRSELFQILGVIFVLVFIGAVTYSLIEGWSLLDALYATVITITTVGYGDVAPKTPEGRLFAIFFTLFAITIGGYSISMLAAYTIERRSRTIVARFRKRLMSRIKSLNQHYILCGADLLGTRIAEELYLEKVPYVIIDSDADLLKTTLLYANPEYFQQKIKTLTDFHDIDLSAYEDLSLSELSEKMGIPYILADATDDSILIQAGIERAAGLIAACSDDRDNLSIVIGARTLAKRAHNDHLKIMTRANSPLNMRKMYLAGADFVRIPTIMSGMEMASHMLHPEIGNWWYSRVGQGTDKQAMFQQIKLQDKLDWIGQSVAKVHEIEQTVILTVKRDGEFISPPPYDFILRANDIAIVVRKRSSK